MQVKICGARTVADAHACAQAGADFMGLNFVAWSPRVVSAAHAARIAAAAPAVTPVGVFMDQPLAEVRAIAAEAGLSWVQLHGQETPADAAALAKDHTVVKALTVDRLGEAAAFAPHVHAFLVDGRDPGSGRAWAWGAVAGPPLPRPVWLAGGLHAENVGAAIAAVGPAAVDTASGVEVDGVMDPARVAAFCRAARGAK